MNRQTFFKQSFSVALGLVLASPLRLFSKDNQSSSIWNELVDYARWCPTVHNLQAHQLRIVSEEIAELYYDPKRLLPVGDPQSIFATVALGVFIEHLSIAAKPYGKSILIEAIHNQVSIQQTNATLFATIKLVPHHEVNEIDRDLIKKRRTSRLAYDGKPLKAETLNTLHTIAAKYNHTFHFTENANLINTILDFNQTILFEDLSDQSNREELDRLFRYDEASAAKTKDGLWSACMGFKGALMQSVFQHHEKWQSGIRKIFLSKHYRHTFSGTSTIAWFKGDFDSVNDWLNAGRLLANSWLHVTKDGAFIQPFGSLITNQNAYKAINQKLESEHASTEKKLWMIFRIGYSKAPARSYRLSTEQIIIK